MAIRKQSKRKLTKKVKEIPKVGSISLLEEIKSRLERSRIYLHREDERIEREVRKPAVWFDAVCKEEHVMPSYIWHINKERIYQTYGNKYYKGYDEKENIVQKKERTKPTGLCEQYFVEEEIVVLPSGKVITPIRQFCEHKILKSGMREAYFYDFKNNYNFGVEEGVTPKLNTTISSNRAETYPYGTTVSIKYTQLEDKPIDIIASANRSFALESVYDENKEILQRTFDNATLPKGHWINGNNGKVITSDKDLGKKDVLTLKGILDAKRIIENEGLDTSQCILYTTGKSIRDLVFDPDLDSYIGFSRPAIITQHTVERITGVKLIRSAHIPSTPESVTEEVPIPETYWQRFKRVLLFKKRPVKIVTNQVNKGYHSVLFLPNITFGLVTGEEMTMESQRRNESQTVNLTGTQRIKGILKNGETAVRISHA